MSRLARCRFLPNGGETSERTICSIASIIFERATAKDATALLDLEKRVAVPKSYEPRVKIEDAIHEIEANTFYFIRYRDRIIGSASFRMQGDGSAYIGNVAVDPLYRRQGVARAAMAMVSRVSNLSDCRKTALVVTTRVSSEPPQA